LKGGKERCGKSASRREEYKCSRRVEEEKRKIEQQKKR
jgi:hypothetical protein